MITALIISNSVLWIVVLLLLVLVFALMRQIGVLHERVFPAGALMTAVGPKVAEFAPSMLLNNFAGNALQVGGKSPFGLTTLLLFVSPSCPLCKTILPIALSVAADEQPGMQVILASDGESPAEQEQHVRFIAAHKIPSQRYVLSKQLGLAYMVEKLPFAVLIDSQGILRAKGMVNSREHLESLFEAHARGVSSLQEYLLAGAQ